jgi:methyltransferase (TIGR00027 family)
VKHKEASRTAEFNALFRALESSRRPRSRRLFEDHLAPGFLGREGYTWFLLSLIPLVGRFVPWDIDSKWPGVRSSAIGRTCWIDDQLRDALKDGISQVVILGAGFDCRAYRLRGIEKTRVYELDHPSTLSAKVKCLKRLLGTIPENVTFVEVDFACQDFAEVLDSSGFDRAIPTFFLWEGVMHYLTAEAVDMTIRSI